MTQFTLISDDVANAVVAAYSSPQLLRSGFRSSPNPSVRGREREMTAVVKSKSYYTLDSNKEDGGMIALFVTNCVLVNDTFILPVSKIAGQSVVSDLFTVFLCMACNIDLDFLNVYNRYASPSVE